MKGGAQYFRLTVLNFFKTAAEIARYLAAAQRKLTYLSVDPLKLSNRKKIRESVNILLLLSLRIAYTQDIH